MIDPVREYCRSKGYADYVIEGGLDYLINTWERIVNSVVNGEVQYQDDYLNDMDTRHIISELIPVATEAQKNAVHGRLVTADERMQSAVIPTEECIWGKENAEKYGWKRGEHWWYFARPRNVNSDWTAL